jgi:hypothetical protein
MVESGAKRELPVEIKEESDDEKVISTKKQKLGLSIMDQSELDEFAKRLNVDFDDSKN